MIQFNLLPDIKIQYLKARRQKRMVQVISMIASAAALVLLVILLATVFVLQRKNLSDLNGDIKTNSSELQKVPNLNKILTVQNQLNALTPLHDKKVVASRLLDYLTQITPAAASISKLNVDYGLNTMSINGTASDLTVVQNYADTLKLTIYQTTSSSAQKNAFSSVVLTSFTRDSQSATYTITFNFDPTIFSSSTNVTLNVPKITTSSSEASQPGALFQPSTQTAGQ